MRLVTEAMPSCIHEDECVEISQPISKASSSPSDKTLRQAVHQNQWRSFALYLVVNADPVICGICHDTLRELSAIIGGMRITANRCRVCAGESLDPPIVCVILVSRDGVLQGLSRSTL